MYHIKDLTILILQYNSADYTLKLLESIILFEGDNLKRYEIVVMDNNSSNDMFEIMKEKFKFVKFVKYEKNYGFGLAHNMYIKNVETDYILLLNNDCVLLNAAIASTLESLKNNDSIDFATCTLKNPDGSCQINFSNTPTPLGRLFINLTGINRVWRTIQLHLKGTSVGYINGAVLFIKKNVIDEIGLFDERYFMYTEDFDLMLRLKKNKSKGYRFAAGEICHYGGASAIREWKDNEIGIIKQNQMVECMKRHYPVWQTKLLLFVLKMIKKV